MGFAMLNSPSSSPAHRSPTRRRSSSTTADPESPPSENQPLLGVEPMRIWLRRVRLPTEPPKSSSTVKSSDRPRPCRTPCRVEQDHRAVDLVGQLGARERPDPVGGRVPVVGARGLQLHVAALPGGARRRDVAVREREGQPGQPVDDVDHDRLHAGAPAPADLLSEVHRDDAGPRDELVVDPLLDGADVRAVLVLARLILVCHDRPLPGAGRRDGRCDAGQERAPSPLIHLTEGCIGARVVRSLPLRSTRTDRASLVEVSGSS